jgi:hypothetical protein
LCPRTNLGAARPGTEAIRALGRFTDTSCRVTPAGIRGTNPPSEHDGIGTWSEARPCSNAVDIGAAQANGDAAGRIGTGMDVTSSVKRLAVPNRDLPALRPLRVRRYVAEV